MKSVAGEIKCSCCSAWFSPPTSVEEVCAACYEREADRIITGVGVSREWATLDRPKSKKNRGSK